mgnify:FL=1
MVFSSITLVYNIMYLEMFVDFTCFISYVKDLLPLQSNTRKFHTSK